MQDNCVLQCISQLSTQASANIHWESLMERGVWPLPRYRDSVISGVCRICSNEHTKHKWSQMATQGWQYLHEGVPCLGEVELHHEGHDMPEWRLELSLQLHAVDLAVCNMTAVLGQQPVDNHWRVALMIHTAARPSLSPISGSRVAL